MKQITKDSGNLLRGRALAGVLLATMIVLTIVHGLTGWIALWPAGVAGWLAGVLLIARTSGSQRAQLGFLVLAGVSTLLLALWLGAEPAWRRVLDFNTLLLTMIAAVSFLRLVALVESAETSSGSTSSGHSQPVGVAAYRRTLLGVALFGSFINMSAPILIADRLTSGGKLGRFTSQSITRVFSGCSSWSPFFGGMAVTLTYVPTANLATVMLTCLPFAIVGFLVVLAESNWRYQDEMQSFSGYPVTFSSLWVPALLATIVIVASSLLPGLSILIIIAIAAIVVSGVVLLFRHGTIGGVRRLGIHIRDGLPSMASELLLFLSAGVLAVGLTALVSAGNLSLPVSDFDANAACALLILIVAASLIGLHPIISIAATMPLVLPVGPPPLLLASTLLMGWSIGTCASPLSGTHIIFQGRYGIPSLKGAIWNWPFAAVMIVFAFVLLQAIGHYTT